MEIKDIKIGRKYLDDTTGVRYILTVVSLLNGEVGYKAFRTTTNAELKEVFYMKSLRFLKYKPYEIKVKATRLAKKMYPNSEEKDGYLLVEA